jgi:hypothetical protein
MHVARRQATLRLGVVSAARRLPLLLLGFVALVCGTGAGLARIGVGVPDAMAGISALHGPLMIGGFLGTVIALERAVAIARPWAYAGPLCAGLGGVAAIAGMTLPARWLILVASVVLLVASLDIVRRQRAMFTWTMAAGALCWAAGNLAWVADLPVHVFVAWWLAFLVLTIAGERLELSRFLPPSPAAQQAFATILAMVAAGLLCTAWRWGEQLFGAGLVALACWLLKQDVARRTVRSRGLTRYIAVCMLSGYAWLAVGGMIVIVAGGFVPGAASYDAALHALALGFVFSMIFGHAPVIVPSVVRIAVPYSPTFYAPLVLLHGSLCARLAGDALGEFSWRRGGAVWNAVALAAFIIVTLASIVRGRRAEKRLAPLS